MRKEHLSAYALKQHVAKRASKGKAPGRKSKSAPKTKKATVELIKSVVARVEETKFRSEVIVAKQLHNSAISVSGDIIRLLPKLAQDDGNGSSFDRLGMKVSVRKLKIDCAVSLAEIQRSMAIVVKYWVLTHKEIKKTTALNVIDLTRLLKTGDSNQMQGFNGQVYDSDLPINNGQFSVLKTGSFMLGKNTGDIQDSTATGNQPMYGNHTLHKWSFMLSCPKTLTYEQDGNIPRTTLFPAGYAPFMVVGYYHQNQSNPDVLNQDIAVTVRSSLYYDDS